MSDIGVQRFKVLIVDDMHYMRELLDSVIKHNFANIETDKAMNGEDAKTKLKLNRYDLVLCDWEMPHIKGDELLMWARNDEAFHSIPFIMITARNNEESVMGVIQYDVTDYIVKPLSVKVLIKKIKSALDTRDEKEQSTY